MPCRNRHPGRLARMPLHRGVCVVLQFRPRVRPHLNVIWGTFLKRLPSLKALRAFESAGRRLSFTRAGEELNVSQGAISHQIGILEQELGFDLFHRTGGGVVLTEKGEALLAVLRQAFGDIASSLEKLAEEREELRIKVQPAFMARWLLPRLRKFQASHPDIQLRITTSLDITDYHSDAFDVTIVTLDVAPRGCNAVLLMKELLVPVCSADFLRLHGPFDSPCDLLRHPIITVTLPGDVKGGDERSYWRRWLDAVGGRGLESKISQEYDTLDAALHAASRGFGTAMADYNLVQEELHEGRLLMPFPTVVDQGVSYYFVTAEDRLAEPRVVKFMNWISSRLAVDRPVKGIEILESTPARPLPCPAT